MIFEHTAKTSPITGHSYACGRARAYKDDHKSLGRFMIYKRTRGADVWRVLHENLPDDVMITVYESLCEEDAPSDRVVTIVDSGVGLWSVRVSADGETETLLENVLYHSALSYVRGAKHFCTDDTVFDVRGL